ncbi:TraB/GumN family protein, partial [Methanolacinia paynteri]|uniref:TraB/GumN family protein n=1 Tax=Methanolacinia paynteri TaxID=230356 RepID=UPI00064F9D46
MGEIRLVGTAHVSQASIDEVRNTIEEYQPDVVAIELDKGRFAAIRNQGEKPTVNEILKGGNFSELLVQWSLAYIQRKIGMDVGVEPGAEMLAAIEEAEKNNIPIALADRDIRLTLSRFWGGMGIIEKLKLLFAVVGAVAGKGDEEEIDIEELTKNQDLIEASIEEFRKFSPKGAAALIGERDAYLTHSLLRLASKHEKVLGIVGAGHVKGIKEYMSKPETLPPFSSLVEQPKGFPWKLAFGVFFVALFAFLILLIGFSGVG